jgi:hypothetical protein
MWLVTKFKEKFKDFNVKWNSNCKKWQESRQVKFLNMKKTYVGKISMHFTIKLFILWCITFYFSFDIIMTFFWIHIFHILCVTNIMSSFQKSTMNPFFFKNSSIIFNKIIAKIYCSMDNEKIENFNFWYDFIF